MLRKTLLDIISQVFDHNSDVDEEGIEAGSHLCGHQQVIKSRPTFDTNCMNQPKI